MNSTTKVLERPDGGAATASGLAFLLATGAAFKQWIDQPISIMPFAIDEAPHVAGVSAAQLADQTKSDISAIYAASGNLFEKRKLGEPTVPLNVQLGATSLQELVRAFNISLSSAEVRGRLAPDGDKLRLQWTTVGPGGIAVEEYYWDAHAGLGYVLYLRGKLPEAADVLGAAVEHDAGNWPLRRLLGSVYAGLCRFDAAHKSYQQAYEQSVARKDLNLGWDLASDWGGVLRRFGLAPWALVQEQRVLATKPGHLLARSQFGVSLIELSDENPSVIDEGMNHLKTAVDQDPDKSDSVLNAYLIQLNGAGRYGDTTAAYEAWSRAGFVPSLATKSLADAAIQPFVPHAHLSYARALAQMDRWADALRELEVLAGTGIALDSSDIALVQLHAANAGADAPALARLQALRATAISGLSPGSEHTARRFSHTSPFF